MMFPRMEDEQREWIYREQVKTNELLQQLINLLSPKDEMSTLKRPELIKRISQLPDKPQGFQKWSNEQLIDFLRGPKP